MNASGSHIDRALTLDARPLLSDFCQQWRLHEHEPLVVNMCILPVISLCCQPEALPLYKERQVML